MPRTNLSDTFASVSRIVGKPKKIANNTFRYTREDGSTVIRLHFTDVVEILKDGRVRLSSGGYKTKTTKDRIDSYIPAPYRVNSVKGVWYVSDGAERVPFFDGMVLPDAFNIKPAKADKLAKDQLKLKEDIKKFVCETIPMKGPLPLPSNGDCWYCLMFDRVEPVERGFNVTSKPAKPAKPATDTTHLVEHIKQKYMHGSLIVNALRYAGISDAGISMYLNGFGSDNDMVRRRVRRYLGNRLGLASN